MHRLAKHEIGRYFAHRHTQRLARALFGLGCAALLIACMRLIGSTTRLPAPLAWLLPAIVFATLYGRWQAGLIAMASGLIGIWLFILPHQTIYQILPLTDGERLFTVGLIGFILLFLTETFRAHVDRLALERETELARRQILLREIEHRTRNNFAMVASLLEFQRRQSTSPEVGLALDDAIKRIHIFADAYTQLEASPGESSEVAMKPYLARLLERFSEGLFSERIAIESALTDVSLPGKAAVAVGLYLNEALTNCAKHAFPEGRAGTVRVTLLVTTNGWQLAIMDDGVGGASDMTKAATSGSGLGGSLFEALAAQAGARHEVTVSQSGRRLDLISRP
ncbi:sensor histidine kinase [Sphingobium lignivorans]|uniref:histidine kinase n=1 Tax=Sphingobium lignivorans TaxID=2735886 RepID=A0ABR6NBQ2_9SPHN|nr:sensor histidine kinase [Sphingobium lignivorans]MBB5984705.1 two-component sensor histidine kinase [Sphingobium lignivorans]